MTEDDVITEDTLGGKKIENAKAVVVKVPLPFHEEMVERQKKLGYATMSNYVRSLIRKDIVTANGNSDRDV